MNNCIFCKIAHHEIPSEIVFEDPKFIAFKDIHPKAKTHILLIPKEHFASIYDLKPKDSQLTADLIQNANRIAKEEGLRNGYRLILNVGKDSGAEVNHLHMHILGGNKLGDLA